MTDGDDSIANNLMSGNCRWNDAGVMDGLVTLQWLPGTKRMIIRHPDNEREMASNDHVLDASVGGQGMLWSMPGECWGIHFPQPPYLAISAGSLTSAFYRVHARLPDSDAVKETLRVGVPC